MNMTNFETRTEHATHAALPYFRFPLPDARLLRP